jgi:hypothetical protein
MTLVTAACTQREVLGLRQYRLESCCITTGSRKSRKFQVYVVILAPFPSIIYDFCGNRTLIHRPYFVGAGYLAASTSIGLM